MMYVGMKERRGEEKVRGVDERFEGPVNSVTNLRTNADNGSLTKPIHVWNRTGQCVMCVLPDSG